MKKLTRPALLTLAVAAVAAAGLGTGAALAASGQFGMVINPAANQAPTYEEAPTYDVNEQGETFGSLADSVSPDTEPDLIQAEATNGRIGYVKKVDLDEANGTTASESFKSPEDAIAWQEERLLKGDVSIPVYESDGKTIIGEFVVYASETQLVNGDEKGDS